jgi:glycosyltransferase involved in cell wall biosynthesis
MNNKIVFICPFDLNWKRGTPYRAKTIIKRISERFEVLVLSMGDFDENNVNLNIYVPKYLPFKTFFLWLSIIKTLFSQKKQPIAIHCFTTTAVLPALIYKFLFNKKTKIIFEMHGISEFELHNTNFIRRLFYTLLDKIGCKFSDEIIVMSYPMKEFVVSHYGAVYDKVHVMWGPINLDIIPYKKPKIKEKFIVGYGGNDSFWQGFDIILKAAELLEKYKDIQFNIIGVPKNKYSDKKNIKFLGKVDDLRYFIEIADCDILLSTRIGEPVANLQYPQKLSAYLAVGRPVIATDVNDVRIIIEKAMCGTVIEPGNAELLAQSILYYFSLYKKQPQKLIEQGENARKFAEKNLSDRVIGERLSRIYLGIKND